MREDSEAGIQPLSRTASLSGAASSVATRFGLGPIDQISFAVTSVERSLPWYEALFGGPFTVRDVTLAPDAVTYRGAPVDAALRLAFGSTAGIEIELVEVLRGEAPSLEHLREHGDGLHHVRFRVADLAAKRDQLTAAGFEVIFDGTTPRGSFTYVQAPASLGHTVIELIQPMALTRRSEISMTGVAQL